MARMTTDHDALVVRLVYDGPPHSGKTTSLGALAEGMAKAVFSPAEADGRTLFFDWLEYTGGSFEGIPIRCQIVSVPGQRELLGRRRALLAEADAVVFVTDSLPAELPAAAAALAELRELLASGPTPRPGIVVQANHRDRPQALSIAALRKELDLDGLALVESVATESLGIREAFVLAVRLALDRARELQARATLPVGPGDTADAGALLAWLQAVEDDPEAAQRGHRAPPAPPPSRRREAGSTPQLPDSSAPSGRVWPPIEGRMLLHSAASPGAVPEPGKDGSWRVRSGAWHFHSAPGHEFELLDDAKQELLRWAQRHAGAFERLSPQRCIALTETGWGTWRLWQVVQAEESLRHRLAAALKECTAAGAAELLAAYGARLLEARAAFSLEPPLPCRLALLGERQGRLTYIGLLPPTGWSTPAEELAITDAELVRSEIQPSIDALKRERRWPAEELFAALAVPAAESGAFPAVAAALTAILAAA